MRKKQLIKVSCSKRVKSIGACAAILMSVVVVSGSAFAQNAARVGYSYISSTSGFATQTLPKQNDSSSYIKHMGKTGAYVQVKSSGINYSANGGSYYVGVGVTRYLPNYVYENGKRNCYLYLTPSPAQEILLYGDWTPDSI